MVRYPAVFIILRQMTYVSTVHFYIYSTLYCYRNSIKLFHGKLLLVLPFSKVNETFKKQILFFLILHLKIGSKVINHAMIIFRWLYGKADSHFLMGKEPFPFCGVCPFVCLEDSLARSGVSGTCQVKTENRGVLANV